MLRNMVVISALLAVAGVGYALGQFIPVTANIRETTTTIAGGKVVLTETREGDYFRSSDGSVLRRWTKVNGDGSQGGVGDLFDNKNLAFYRLNYNSRQASEGRFKPQEPMRPDAYSSSPLKSLGESFVEGIPCTLVPVLLDGPGIARHRVGQSCVSSKYGLRLREEESIAASDGTRHTVFEMYNIRLNQEPDSRLFDVQGNFAVSKPSVQEPAPRLEK